MGTRFERITASPDALAAVLASIPTTDAPWDTAFERAFCAGCALENCDDCLHKNVDRIKWWLGKQMAQDFLTRKSERYSVPFLRDELQGWMLVLPQSRSSTASGASAGLSGAMVTTDEMGFGQPGVIQARWTNGTRL